MNERPDSNYQQAKRLRSPRRFSAGCGQMVRQELPEQAKRLRSPQGSRRGGRTPDGNATFTSVRHEGWMSFAMLRDLFKRVAHLQDARVDAMSANDLDADSGDVHRHRRDAQTVLLDRLLHHAHMPLLVAGAACVVPKRESFGVKYPSSARTTTCRTHERSAAGRF